MTTITLNNPVEWLDSRKTVKVGSFYCTEEGDIAVCRMDEDGEYWFVYIETGEAININDITVKVRELKRGETITIEVN